MPATIEEILNSHHTGRAVVMGILNVTPDSFSDGGQFLSAAAAVEHAGQLAAQGADIIDVGAESTRPGSQPVPADEQIARLRNVVGPVCRLGPVVSIDTTSADVARFALDHGAKIINDISAGRQDAQMLPLAGQADAPIILMHMLGQPQTMQRSPQYQDVVGEVRDFLADRLNAAAQAGVARNRCIVDPGIGFGKRLEHNLALLANLKALAGLGVPVLVGPSRKRFIGDLTGANAPADRLGGTIAACVAAYEQGATIFRVHDVGQVLAGLSVAAAIRAAAGATQPR